MTSPELTGEFSKTPPPIMDLDVMKSEIESQLPPVLPAPDANAAAREAANNWMRLMDLEIDDNVAILLVGGTPNDWYRGALVNVTFGPQGPLLICFRIPDGPLISAPWSSVALIHKTIPAPVASGPTPEAVVKFMEEQGVEIPDEVRAYLAENPTE